MNEQHFRERSSRTLIIVSESASALLAGVSLAVALPSQPPPPVKAFVGGVVFLTVGVNALPKPPEAFVRELRNMVGLRAEKPTGAS